MRIWRAERNKSPKQAPISSSFVRRRLFLVATSLVARGMKPDEAYKTALYYTEGPGRGRTWISALAEQDDRRGSQSDRRSA
jgi:hypothetical protein